MFQRHDAHRDILRFVGVQDGNELAREREIFVIVGDDDLVGALIDINDAFLGEGGFHPFLDFGGLKVLKREDFHQLLSAFGNVFAVEHLGTHLRLLTFGHDHDRFAGLDGRKALEAQGAINQVEGFTLGDFF